VADLMFISNTISAQNYRALEIFTLAAFIYFAIAFPVSLITSAIERRMQNTAGPGFKPGPSLLARMMPGTKVAAAKVPA
jgi:polar amino acid transport system permease protein